MPETMGQTVIVVANTMNMTQKAIDAAFPEYKHAVYVYGIMWAYTATRFSDEVAALLLPANQKIMNPYQTYFILDYVARMREDVQVLFYDSQATMFSILESLLGIRRRQRKKTSAIVHANYENKLEKFSIPYGGFDPDRISLASLRKLVVSTYRPAYQCPYREAWRIKGVADQYGFRAQVEEIHSVLLSLTRISYSVYDSLQGRSVKPHICQCADCCLGIITMDDTSLMDSMFIPESASEEMTAMP